MSEYPIANRIIQRNRPLPGFIQVVDEKTLSAAASGEVSLQVKECDFLWCASAAVSTGKFRVRVNAVWEAGYLDNNPTRSENFWGEFGAGATGSATTKKGIGYHPPKFMPKGAEVTFELTETGDVSNTIALYLIGARASVCDDKNCTEKGCKCDRGRWGKGRGLYIYNSPSGTSTSDSATNKNGYFLGANGNLMPSIKIEDAHHFRCSAINRSCTSDSWKGSFQYWDARDDRRRQPMSSKARAVAWTGNNIDPGMPISPFIAHKGSTINYDLDDISGSTNRIHLCHIGERLNDDLVRRNA